MVLLVEFCYLLHMTGNQQGALSYAEEYLEGIATPAVLFILCTFHAHMRGNMKSLQTQDKMTCFKHAFRGLLF